MLEQTIEYMGQHFVRAVAEEHLIGLHAVVLRHRLLEQVTVGVRVQTQVVIDLGLHRCQRLG